MAEEENDEGLFEELEVDFDSDLPVHEKFVDRKKLKKTKNSERKDIRKF